MKNVILSGIVFLVVQLLSGCGKSAEPQAAITPVNLYESQEACSELSTLNPETTSIEVEMYDGTTYIFGAVVEETAPEQMLIANQVVDLDYCNVTVTNGKVAAVAAVVAPTPTPTSNTPSCGGFLEPQCGVPITLVCNGHITTITVKGPSMEPVECPAN